MEQIIKRDFFVKHGLIFGGVGMGYTLIAYLFGIEFMSGTANSLINVTLIIALMFFIGTSARKLAGGFISFNEVFKAIFFSVFLGTILYILFNLLLFTLIDPGLFDRIWEFSMDKQAVQLEDSGMSDDQIDETLAMSETIKEYMLMRYSVLGFIIEVLATSVIMAIPALIVAAIVKKTPPPTLETLDQ